MLAIMIVGLISAQTKIIEGKIANEKDNRPINFATIKVLKTNKFVISNS
jgi:hypothetical protein